MKYSIVSAHDAESLLEWGAAHAVRHGLRFSCVRGGGACQRDLSCVCLSVQNSDGKNAVLEARKPLIMPIGASKRRVFACKNICELRCSRACQGQLYVAGRLRLCSQTAAPCARNFAAYLGRKPVRKGGILLVGDQGEDPWGGKRPQNCTDGAPKSAFQTSAEAGK